MTIYRHVRPADLDYWRNGSVRLRTLSYFRGIEGEEEGIRDEIEGHSVALVNYRQGRGQPKDEATRQRLWQEGLMIAPGANANIENCQITVGCGEHYILCFSTNPTSGLFSERSIVLKIEDPASLFLAINEAMSLSRNVGNMGSVTYTNKVVEISQGAPPRPHPLLKRPCYTDQREYRYYWPTDEPSPDFRDVRSAKVANLVVGWNPDVFRNVA